MSAAVLLVVAGLVLLAGAAGALVCRSNRTSGRVALVTQALATACVLAGIVPVLAGGSPILAQWAAPRPVETVIVRADALSAFFLLWSLPMTWLGTVYAVGYLAPYFARGRHGGPHFALLNLTALSFIVIYASQNALVFLLGWEIAAVAAWLLVIWDYSNQKIRFAGFNYLVSTHVGMFVLVAAFMRLHANTGSMDFAAFGEFLSRSGSPRGPIFFLLGAAFALKSAFYPFHTWLPRAHSAAPAHVSALMSGVIHKAGLFGFIRFSLMLGTPDEWMGWTVLGFGALSAFFGAIYTTPQRDLKRLLGYSSTENVGIAAMGFGVGYLGWTWHDPALAAAGFAGGLLHVLNHAFFKCLLFYAAGSVYRVAHSVDLERLGGLSRRLPATAALFLVGGLAISALPPLNGFTSELLIYSGLLGGAAPTAPAQAALACASALLAFVGAVSAFSITRAFGLAFLGRPREPGQHAGREEPRSMLAPMLVHAAGVVALGLVPSLGAALLAPVLALFPLAAASSARDAASALTVLDAVTPFNRALAALLLLTGALAWARGRRSPTGTTWGCGYTAGTARMQYTASSFAEQLARILGALLPSLRRERLPAELFPRHQSHLATHHYDAVERRVFEVLGQGEEAAHRTADRVTESARGAFAAALVLLLVAGILASWGVGR